MNISGLIKRITPLCLKISGKLPQCPWSSVMYTLNPRTLNPKHLPIKIDVIETDGDFKKLRFNNKHNLWFPCTTRVNEDLWNEYLSVTWNSPVNSHYYFRDTVRIQPGDVCLDCGTCEGIFALLALEAGAKKVICIEPNEVMISCLQKTFFNEIRQEKIFIYQAALGGCCGETFFSYDASYPSYGTIGNANTLHRSKIPLKTIDAIVNEIKLDSIHFIKMDIEGAELEAIKGASQTILTNRPKLAITTYHNTYDFKCLSIILDSYQMTSLARGITLFGSETYRPVLLHSPWN